MPQKISAVIITKNEERNIGRCLDSLQGVADEVLVVDSFSTDGTQEICLSKGARVLEHPFEGHIEQKNYAMEQATYPMVLSLDADEALSPELKNSLQMLKSSAAMADAYAFNRLTCYCGHWVHHCGWYPDRKIRLWNRTKGSWGGENPHDKVVLQTNVQPKRLAGDLLHYSFYSISDHVQTADKFSEIAAKVGFAKGKKPSLLVHVILNPLFTFFKKYVVQLGFLDGYYGLIICVLSAYANFLKYTKTRELFKHG